MNRQQLKSINLPPVLTGRGRFIKANELMEDNRDTYFDLKKLAAYSCLSVHTLRDYIADPADPLPSFCVRKKILVRKSEFDQWMDRHRYNGGKLDTMVDEFLNDLQA